jgi:hypothetical protein
MDSKIDDETIITFAFYLHTAILKVSKDRSMLKYEIENYYSDAVSLTEGGVSIEFLADKFKSNKQELVEIYQNIMVENQPELPGWVADWIAYINDEIEMDSVNLKAVLPIEKYYKIISMLNQHLGLSDNSWLMVSYLLQQTIYACRCDANIP